MSAHRRWVSITREDETFVDQVFEWRRSYSFSQFFHDAISLTCTASNTSRTPRIWSLVIKNAWIYDKNSFTTAVMSALQIKAPHEKWWVCMLLLMVKDVQFIDIGWCVHFRSIIANLPTIWIFWKFRKLETPLKFEFERETYLIRNWKNSWNLHKIVLDVLRSSKCKHQKLKSNTVCMPEFFRCFCVRTNLIVIWPSIKPSALS